MDVCRTRLWELESELCGLGALLKNMNTCELSADELTASEDSEDADDAEDSEDDSLLTDEDSEDAEESDDAEEDSDDVRLLDTEELVS